MSLIQVVLIVIFQAAGIGFALRARHDAKVAEYQAEQAVRWAHQAHAHALRAEAAYMAMIGGPAA